MPSTLCGATIGPVGSFPASNVSCGPLGVHPRTPSGARTAARPCTPSTSWSATAPGHSRTHLPYQRPPASGCENISEAARLCCCLWSGPVLDEAPQTETLTTIMKLARDRFSLPCLSANPRVRIVLFALAVALLARVSSVNAQAVSGSTPAAPTLEPGAARSFSGIDSFGFRRGPSRWAASPDRHRSPMRMGARRSCLKWNITAPGDPD